jgi:hypothetical protein
MPRLVDGELVPPNVCPKCKSSYWNKPKRREITKMVLPSMDIREKEKQQDIALANKPKFKGMR